MNALPSRKKAWTRASLLLLAATALGCASTLPPETRSPGTVATAFSYARVDALEKAPEFGGLVYVVDAGPNGAPPLVLIHGFGSNGARDFEPILAALSADHRVLAFDLPGFGRSTLAEQKYSPERYVRFIRSMIESRFADQPVALVGHSMGGALAIGYAGAHPDAVSHLALLDVAGVLYYRDYLFELGNDSADEDNPLDNALSSLRNTAFSLPLGVMPLESFDLSERDGPLPLLSVETTTAMLFVAHNFGPALYRVTAPSLLGWGRNDGIAPQRAEAALGFALPSPQRVMFEDSGHVPMKSEPEQVAEALLTFFSAAPQAMPAAGEFEAGRVGTCIDSEDRLFEGDYDAIYLKRCDGALLRGVRTHRLWIENSVAALESVDIQAPRTAVTFVRSRVQ